MVATCGLFSEEWGQFETQTFAHACSEACVFMEEDQMMEIMQNLAQQILPLSKKLESNKIPSYGLYFKST